MQFATPTHPYKFALSHWVFFLCYVQYRELCFACHEALLLLTLNEASAQRKNGFPVHCDLKKSSFQKWEQKLQIQSLLNISICLGSWHICMLHGLHGGVNISILQGGHVLQLCSQG